MGGHSGYLYNLFQTRFPR